MTMSIFDINLTSGYWDRTNQTLMSPLHRRDKAYTAYWNPPGLNTSSVSAAMSRLYCGSWKIITSGEIFLSCCNKIFVNFFQKELLDFKFISKIVKENTYGERRIQMSSDQVGMYSTHLVKILPENFQRTLCSTDVLKTS